MMKKGIITAIMTSLLAVGIPFASPATSDAQSRYCTCRTVRHRSARRVYRRSEGTLARSRNVLVRHVNSRVAEISAVDRETRGSPDPSYFSPMTQARRGD